MALLVLLNRDVILDADWDDKVHDIPEHINSGLVYKLCLASLKELSTTQIVLLKHIVHDQVQLFSLHALGNLTKAGLKDS